MDSDIFSVMREEGISRWQQVSLDVPFWAPDERHVAARRKAETLLATAFHNFFGNPMGQARAEPPAVWRLSEIWVPTLIFIGERDAPDSRAIANTLEVGISETEKVVMLEAGHMLHLEKPEEFNRLVLRFLERLEAQEAR
jgi:3-oxoadipate enol-lactonase